MKKKPSRKNLKSIQIRKVNSETKYQFYKASIPLLVKSVKPIIIIVIIVVFWSPLRTLVESLPSLLARTSKVSLGDLGIDIRNALFSDPPTAIEPYLSTLSSDALSFLTIEGEILDERSNSYHGYWCDTTKDEFYEFNPGLKELEQKGIVEFTQIQDRIPNQSDDCPSQLAWSFTSLGKDISRYLKTIVIHEFKEAWEESR